MIEPITFVCMSTPNYERLQRLVPTVLPYVDKVLIVIGKRDKDSEDFLIGLGGKVQVVYRPWDDSFANQWNEYLRHVHSGWVLICDDDEVPSTEMLQVLRPLVDNSNQGDNYCLVKFQANGVSEGTNLGPSGYYREIFFKIMPGMKYKGGPVSGCHQYIVGYKNGKAINRNEVYYHIKSLREEYEGASRNYFIYGIWPHGAKEGQRREDWHSLRECLARTYPGLRLWPELNALLKAGNIKQELKDWLITYYKKYIDDPMYNEFRALPIYYFRHLHPEEDVLGLFK